MDSGLEFARLFPVLQISGAVKFHIFSCREHQAVALLYGVPEDLGVAEVRLAFVCYDWIPVILFKMFIVQTVCNALLLQMGRCIMAGINGYHRRIFKASEAGQIFFVQYAGARKDTPQFIGIQSGGKMLPVEQIPGNGVAPMHRPPVGGRRIILVKQMVSAVCIYHAVRIIHPVCRRGKMNDRSVVVFCLHCSDYLLFIFLTIVMHGIKNLLFLLFAASVNS